MTPLSSRSARLLFLSLPRRTLPHSITKLERLPPRTKLDRPALFFSSSTSLSRKPPNAGHRTEAQLVVDDIEELYATAQDEYEIALEETKNGTIYAEADRQAAKEQVEKMLKAYIAVMEGNASVVPDKFPEKLHKRIQQLAKDVTKLEELAAEHD